MIRPEIDEELLKLKNIGNFGKQWIAKLEAEERNKTGITNLKVRIQ